MDRLGSDLFKIMTCGTILVVILVLIIIGLGITLVAVH
jgi:hypothetical protein